MKRNSRILHLLTTSFNSYKIIKPQWCLLSAIMLKAKVGSAFAARISQKPKARFIISCLCVFLYFASSARTHNQASHNILSLCVYSLKLRQKEAAPAPRTAGMHSQPHSLICYFIHSDCIKRALQIATNNIHIHTHNVCTALSTLQSIAVFHNPLIIAFN